jgi:hypothetical protein
MAGGRHLLLELSEHDQNLGHRPSVGEVVTVSAFMNTSSQACRWANSKMFGNSLSRTETARSARRHRCVRATRNLTAPTSASRDRESRQQYAGPFRPVLVPILKWGVKSTNAKAKPSFSASLMVVIGLRSMENLLEQRPKQLPEEVLGTVESGDQQTTEIHDYCFGVIDPISHGHFP